MTQSNTVSLIATNRALRTGLNEDFEFGTWATASMSLRHNGNTVATWRETNVDRLLARMSKDFTARLGKSLKVDLYEARVLHTSPEALSRLTPVDFYLSVVRSDTDESVHMDYVSLPVFRRAVAVARASHSAWLATQHPRPVFKPR